MSIFRDVISGVLGLPLLCGATVRSVTHLNALCVYSKTYAPGEKPKLEYVMEQRITGICVFILLGKRIPLSFAVIWNTMANLRGSSPVDRYFLQFLVCIPEKFSKIWPQKIWPNSKGIPGSSTAFSDRLNYRKREKKNSRNNRNIIP